mmetsp:Transcript_32052/g.75174  ORF Transcript_32052/g.75174 Transcript_32052/m.75174 type:complete len:330 (+) Transcript_32052:129-1118(+)
MRLFLLACFATLTAAQPQRCLLSIQRSLSKVDAVLAPSDAAGSRLENVSQLLCPFADMGQNLGFNGMRQSIMQYWKGPDIHPLLLPEQGKKKTAKTCAVVSNSGVMLHHKHGAEIDSADLVFRFNDGPHGGELKEYVGERNDVHFLNGPAMSRLISGMLGDNHQNKTHSASTSTLYVFQRFQDEDQFHMFDQLRNDQKRHPHLHLTLGSSEVLGFSQNLMQSIFTTGGWSKLTTGFFGVLVTMAMCDEVRAYGFPDTPGSATAPFHYFGDQMTGSASVNTNHKGAADREKELWRRIALNEDVTETDVAVLPGWHTLKCGHESHTAGEQL